MAKDRLLMPIYRWSHERGVWEQSPRDAGRQFLFWVSLALMADPRSYRP